MRKTDAGGSSSCSLNQRITGFLMLPKGNTNDRAIDVSLQPSIWNNWGRYDQWKESANLGGGPMGALASPFMESVMDRNAQLTDILFQCVKEYSEQAGNELPLNSELALIGPDSPLDSLGLVMLVTSFEAKVNDQFDSQIVLANEKALSMKRSPFRSVQTLASYAGELLGLQEAA